MTWLFDLLGRPLTLNNLMTINEAPHLFQFRWLPVVLWWSLLQPDIPLSVDFFTEAQVKALSARKWGPEGRGRNTVREAAEILTELGQDRKAEQLLFLIRSAEALSANDDALPAEP